VAERSGDTAFARAVSLKIRLGFLRAKSGVALRFPPQSKIHPVPAQQFRLAQNDWQS